MPFIYSTLTCTNNFAVYAPKSDANQLSRIVKKIEVLGGHGMKNPKGLDTPKGVVTKVSDGDLELLEKDLSFQKQIESGFITVDKKQVDVAKKADSMNQKDGSSPLTPKDFEPAEDSTKEVPIYKQKGK